MATVCPWTPFCSRTEARNLRAKPRCGWSPRGRQLRKDARGVDVLVLIKVVVQFLLFHLKAVCSLSTPCLITIAKHEKANSK